MSDLIQKIEQMSKRMRKRILDMSLACKSSAHLGGGLSMVELMATLYGAILRFDKNNPTWEDRDRFILSKGHGVLGFFPALVESGIISEEKFSTFKQNESDLIAHPVMKLELGIESSNGSLGQGLSLGIGLAWAAKKKNKQHRVFVLLGDGECNEGSVWEAAMAASHYCLDNLTAIIDYNKLQSDGESKNILNSEGMADKWRAFGWNTIEIDGHNISQIYEALTQMSTLKSPRAIVAHTIKGKGISFMENNNEWHHNRLTKATYDLALAELGEVI